MDMFFFNKSNLPRDRKYFFPVISKSPDPVFGHNGHKYLYIIVKTLLLSASYVSASLV